MEAKLGKGQRPFVVTPNSGQFPDLGVRTSQLQKETINQSFTTQSNERKSSPYKDSKANSGTVRTAV